MMMKQDLKGRKLVYALVVATKHQRPYFQAHSMMIVTDQSLKAILQPLNISEMMAKWTIRLGEFHIFYQPFPVMKAQTLANFITECTWTIEEDKQKTTKGEVNQEKADEECQELV